MRVDSIDLIWVVVKDLKTAIKFYTEVVGLKIVELNEQFGWAEMTGHDGGMRLGIAQQNDMDALPPGQNAIVTLSVADLVKAKADLSHKGVTMVGDILEIPGIVKMQMIVDKDGNQLQLVQTLEGHSHK